MPNIEEHLRRAMADGKFDNLPGKGKPLRLDESNPHADPEWELAYRMLKESGFTLPWIETIREIEKDIDAARKDLQIAWKCHQASLLESQIDSLAAGEWKRACKSSRISSPHSTSASAITTCRCQLRASSALD